MYLEHEGPVHLFNTCMLEVRLTC